MPIYISLACRCMPDGGRGVHSILAMSPQRSELTSVPQVQCYRGDRGPGAQCALSPMYVRFLLAKCRGHPHHPTYKFLGLERGCPDKLSRQISFLP